MKANNICCIGGNHAGGVSSCVIALKCPEVRITVVDNEKTISEWNSDTLPFNEPDLNQILKKCRNRNLFFSSNYASNIRDADLIFLPLNVPINVKTAGKQSVSDFRELEQAGKLIAAHSESDKIIVEKSTIAARAVEKITTTLESYGHPAVRYQVLSNPDFLTRGSAVKDLLNPNYILIGCQKNPNNKAAAQSLCELYERWVPRKKIIILHNWSVEVSSLAGNAFLAQKIASINTLATICEETRADINKILHILGSDPRIETKNLSPTLGFPIFQKDLLNLILMCESLKLHEVASYWQAVLEMNCIHTKRFIDRAKIILGPIEDEEITVLGFTQDKNMPEKKNSLTLEVCDWLLQEKCNIKIYEPVVHAKRIVSDLNIEFDEDKKKRIQIFRDINLAIMGTSGIIICTNWDEFLNIDFHKAVKWMKKPIVIDAHCFLNGNRLKAMGLEYHTLGLV